MYSTRWPRWMGPFAYGRALVTRIRRFGMMRGKTRLRGRKGRFYRNLGRGGEGRGSRTTCKKRPKTQTRTWQAGFTRTSRLPAPARDAKHAIQTARPHGATTTIHGTPNWSTTMPKRGEKNVL